MKYENFEIEIKKEKAYIMKYYGNEKQVLIPSYINVVFFKFLKSKDSINVPKDISKRFKQSSNESSFILIKLSGKFI